MTPATLVRKLRSVLLAASLSRRAHDDRDFVLAAHERILRRPADAAALAQYAQVLADGAPRRILVEMLLLTQFTDRLHAVRCDMIRQLPPAETIVDLGGASAVAPEGALLNMGYPHAPRELTILDLPPDTRLGAGGFPYLEGETTHWQTFGPCPSEKVHPRRAWRPTGLCPMI